MRIKQLLVFILAILPGVTMAQGTYKFFVRFTDKNGSPYNISNPSAFLTQRAIDRRTVQQIPVTDQDIPVNQSYIDGVSQAGGVVICRSKWFNGAVVQCDSTTLTSILNLSYVAGAKRILRTTSKHIDKSDPVLELQPSALRTNSLDYGGSYNQIHLMNGDYLHDAGYTGDGMVIALLDAGFYSVDVLPAFDSLRTRGGILGTWDFVDDNSSVYEDDTHGMEVLSTIAGNIPGQLVGTAPHADFWLLRSEDNFSENLIEEYNWASAAEFADSVGADVISSSLGYSEFDDATMSHSYSDMDGNTCPSSIAADIAVSKGILVLVSAGNSGGSPWHYISAPSDADSVLAVAAVDEFGNYVGFSSWGPSSDGDVKPNVAAKGLGATLSDWSGNISTGSGTSFACPILAGSATCLLQAHQGLKIMQVKEAIEQSANYYLQPSDSLGYGIPNFATADVLLNVAKSGSLPEQEISVFPNPFSDQLNVRLMNGNGGELSIEIYDSKGAQVFSGKQKISSSAMQFLQIPMQSMKAEGIYLCKLSDGSRNKTIRLVKTSGK
ncbi:MAG: S8 family serine peptidase [Bacteroidia bacterium]